MPRPRLIQTVAKYGWRLEDGTVIEHAFDAYWPLFPGIQEIEGRRYIVPGPGFEDVIAPDYELLACGHEQDVRTGRGGKYFTRRRRCDSCAIDALRI